MNEETAVVIGATGLIGNLVVRELLENEYYKIVRILVRRPVSITHPKLEQLIVNFDDVNDYAKKFGEGDVIFCCIGTTQKKVKGDNAAYKKIDYDIPVNAARIGVENRFKKYLIVSSVGADSNSSNFYLKLKGELENTLKQFPFEQINIFRPSMLLGKRNESRSGEGILQTGIKALSFFLIGPLKKYHAINAKDVAQAMVAESKLKNSGVRILEYPQIKDLIRRFDGV